VALCGVAASLLGDGRATHEPLTGLGVIEDGVFGVHTMLNLDVSGFGGRPVLLDRLALFKVGGHAGSFL
jgi:hypothetical protein